MIREVLSFLRHPFAGAANRGGIRILWSEKLVAFPGETLEPPDIGRAAATDPDIKDLDPGCKRYFDIALQESQTFAQLEEAFEWAGFDKHRGKIEMGGDSFGSSYSKNEAARTADVFIYPMEAQSLRYQGFNAVLDTQTPLPRIRSASVSIGVLEDAPAVPGLEETSDKPRLTP